MKIWRGKGRTFKTAAKFVNDEAFCFGGKLIPAGSRCKQWETTNYGWTLYIEPDSAYKHLAKE